MSRWKKGESGNPAGKKPGTRHRATLAAQALLDGEAETITRKAVELALDGNPIALRLCLERLVPARRDRPLTVKLPRVKEVGDIPKAQQAVLKAVAGGEITPGEGQALTAIIEAYRKGLELADLTARVEALEDRRKRGK